MQVAPIVIAGALCIAACGRTTAPVVRAADEPGAGSAGGGGSAAPGNTDTSTTAESVLSALSDAFSRKDLGAIVPLIADGWSGIRFTATWDDANWTSAAAALRTAKPTSSTSQQRTFAIVIKDPGGTSRAREIQMVRGGERGWRLDYNSFMGPFPHE